ncbi:hypothetical protein BH11ACT6_BH11ACT6_19580 [soil metagenome]
MNRTFSRRIASALAMPVLAAGLIGGGAVVISGAAPAYASPVAYAVADAQPATPPIGPSGRRWLGASPAATTPVEPARIDSVPGNPVALYPTSL